MDFWIFVVMVAIRHKHRLVQKSHRKFKGSDDDDDDDEDEDSDIGTDDLNFNAPVDQEMYR